MIEKISKLKNCGIFYDFSWEELLPFGQFNIIYGWNRSGKTTISRVFASCEKGHTYDEDKFKQYPENGEFELETYNKTTVKHTDVATNVLPIKVFNQDFIDENISFDPSDPSKPIVYVSKQDIKNKERLAKLKENETELDKNFKQAVAEKASADGTKGTFLTNLGREIANALFDKSYDKRKVEKKIKEIGIDNFKELSNDERQKNEITNKTEARADQDPLSEYKFSFSFREQAVDNFQKIYKEIQKLLDKEVISETLERLKDDQDLNNWVQEGFYLHKDKDEKEKCLFCQKPLDNDFLGKLSKHFNKDYEKLQSDLKNFKEEILKIKKEALPVENSELYPDLMDDYSNRAKKLNEHINKTNEWICQAAKKLDEKYNNPLVAVASPKEPKDFLASHNEHVGEINKVIIAAHNEKVENHDTVVTEAKDKLEQHYIAVALSDSDYKKMEENIEIAEKERVCCNNLIAKNDLEISKLEKQTSDIQEAIEEINKHLKGFFGGEEIELELDSNKNGYTIKREGQLAKNLSEAEKTAIAFSYFIAKFGEKDFNKAEGIIFIDDPISSFDSNFIYHCFALINIYFKEVEQLFISTHNFQLFNLTKEWFLGKNRSVNNKNKELENKGKPTKPIPSEFFMIENFIESDVRKARIVELDKTLLKYKSEYNFLFAKLKEFVDKQDTEYEDFYIIGNMARRFFEAFADFKLMTTGDQRSKMEALVKDINEDISDPSDKIDEAEALSAYKLMADFSHNSDPTSNIEHKDKAESKKAIQILLDIVKKSDPKHFANLEKSLG